MNDEVKALASKIVAAYRNLPDDRRLLVAIAGPPGSGKSTLAYPLTDYINTLLRHPPEDPTRVDPVLDLAHPGSADPASASTSTSASAASNGTSPTEFSNEARIGGEDDKQVAICVGLDGWHYSRAELDTFEDPVEAHWRRGAAFTFNLPAYLAFLLALRLPITSGISSQTNSTQMNSMPLSSTTAVDALATNPTNPTQPSVQPKPVTKPALHPTAIPFPTFSHELKDPLPSPEPIRPHHRIVLIEGLYTMLDKPGWRDCAEMMDLRVWVETDREVCRQRVIKRNWKAGIVDTLEKCEERVDASDMVNGDEVRQHRYSPTDIVHSV